MAMRKEGNGDRRWRLWQGTEWRTERGEGQGVAVTRCCVRTHSDTGYPYSARKQGRRVYGNGDGVGGEGVARGVECEWLVVDGVACIVRIRVFVFVCPDAVCVHSCEYRTE